MDNRLYFVIGDLVANLTVGALVALLCWLLVGTSWNMWLAMFVCMPLGMLASLFIWLPFSIYFGAMEVMVPTMMTGMVSAMFVGMKCAMMPIAATTALTQGALWGLATLVLIWVMNALVRGSTKLPTRSQP